MCFSFGRRALCVYIFIYLSLSSLEAARSLGLLPAQFVMACLWLSSGEQQQLTEEMRRRQRVARLKQVMAAVVVELER